MVRFRLFPPLLALITYAALAVVGQLLAAPTVLSRIAEAPQALRPLLYQLFGPVGGRLFHQSSSQSVVAWISGMAVAAVVLVLVVLLASLADHPLATLLGGWLGAVLASGIGGAVSGVVFAGAAASEYARQFQQLQAYQGLSQGSVWGVLFGLLVGLVAMLGTAGARKRRDRRLLERHHGGDVGPARPVRGQGTGAPEEEQHTRAMPTQERRR